MLPPVIDAVCSGQGPTRHRERIIPLATGRVLDLGTGSGLNLGYADPAKVETWVGLDPSPNLLARATARARDVRFPVRWVEGRGEDMPFDDRAFDTVVLTYAFCSVDDPERTAREIARVIADGGQVLFAEHGLALGRGSRALQRRLDPGWRRIAGGCRLDRDVVASLVATGRLQVDWVRVREDFPKWMSTIRSGRALAIG